MLKMLKETEDCIKCSHNYLSRWSCAHEGQEPGKRGDRKSMEGRTTEGRKLGTQDGRNLEELEKTATMHINILQYKSTKMRELC